MIAIEVLKMKQWFLLLGALLLSACSNNNQQVSALAKPPSGSANGTGMVFIANPVQSSGTQTLSDQEDADAAVPASAYYKVALTNLDGSGYLRGDWANVRSETGDPAYSPTNTFNYTRHDDRFEQVMAYFWITEAQKYIQSLGFGKGEFPAVNKESQDVRVNQWGLDNSFDWDKHDYIKLGKGAWTTGKTAK